MREMEYTYTNFPVSQNVAFFPVSQNVAEREREYTYTVYIYREVRVRTFFPVRQQGSESVDCFPAAFTTAALLLLYYCFYYRSSLYDSKVLSQWTTTLAIKTYADVC